MAMEAEREAAGSVLKQTLRLSAAERIAELMKAPAQTKSDATSVIRGDAGGHIEPRASAAAASAGAATQGATVVQTGSGGRARFPRAASGPGGDEESEPEKEGTGVSVLRLEAEVPGTGR